MNVQLNTEGEDSIFHLSSLPNKLEEFLITTVKDGSYISFLKDYMEFLTLITVC